MKCPKCGVKNEEGNLFCYDCGYDLKGPPPPPPPLLTRLISTLGHKRVKGLGLSGAFAVPMILLAFSLPWEPHSGPLLLSALVLFTAGLIAFSGTDSFENIEKASDLARSAAILVVITGILGAIGSIFIVAFICLWLSRLLS